MSSNCWADYDLSNIYTHLLELMKSVWSKNSKLPIDLIGCVHGINGIIDCVWELMRSVWIKSQHSWHDEGDGLIFSVTHRIVNTLEFFCFGLVVWYNSLLVVKIGEVPYIFLWTFPCNHIYVVGMQKPGLLIGEDTFQCNVSTSGSFHWTMICQKFIDALAIHNTVLNNKTHILCSPNDTGKHNQLFYWHPSYFWIPEMSWKCETI
jgi:hypothetical protein